MSNKVTVIRPSDGAPIEVDEADVPALSRAGYRAETVDTFTERNRATAEEAHYSSIGQKVTTAFEGAMSGATLGLSDVGGRAFSSDEENRAADLRREHNPITRGVSEAAGALISALPTGGESLAAALPANLVGRAGTAIAGQAGSKLVGRAAEGVVWGVAGEVQRSNVTADPLTVDSIIEGATLGAVLNVATGALGDRLGLMGTRAKEKVATEVAEEADRALIARRASQFDDPPPSWEELKGVHRDTQKSLSKQNRQLEDEAFEYRRFLDEELNDRLKTDVSSAINEVRSYYAPVQTALKDVDAALPSFQNVAAEDVVSTVNARSLHGKGFHQPPGVGADKVKFDKARKVIEKGQEDPIEIAVSPRGGYYVMDGRHRLAAAIESDSPIAVKWVKGAADLDGKVSKKTTQAWEYVRGGPGKGAPLVTPSGEVSIPAGRRVSHTAEGRRVYEYNSVRKPPMSEETANFLRDIEERKSRALKLWGGGRDVTKKTWSKHDPNIPADREAAIAELRNIKAEFEARFPQASTKFKELPHRPPPSTPFDAVDLPKSLDDFGRMNGSQLSRFIQAAERHPPVREALERVMKDLDVTIGDSAASSVSNLHGVLTAHRTAMQRLEASAAKEAAKHDEGFLPWLRGKTRNAVKYATGREADRAAGYGWKGALLKSGVGAAVGGAISGTEGALLGATLMGSRQRTKHRIRNVVAKYGERGGRGLTRLGPVTSYFSGRFPDGEPDPEKDVRQRTVNRIADLSLAAQLAPDTMFYAVESLMGDESDIAWKHHSDVNRRLQYLVAAAPKDPGLDISIGGSRWNPTHQQVVEFAHVFEAVTNPMAAVERALGGDGHPAAAKALWETSPGLMTELATEFMANADRMKISYEAGGAFRDLFRVPITGLQQPEVVATLQGLYLPKPAQPDGQGSTPSQNPTGRPPAVRSQVAGSSVSGLIA